MLSDVMANAKVGELWITNQAHPNIADVASVKELCGILLANGRTPYPDTLERAEREGTPILGSHLTAFELTSRIGKMLAAGGLRSES